MEEFKGNSDVAKERKDRPKLEQVANVTIKEKKTDGFFRYFFAKDLKTAASDVNRDIVLPGIKNLIVNVLVNSVYNIFGSSGGGVRNGNFTSYTSYARPVNNVSYGAGYNANKPLGSQLPANQSKVIDMYNVSNVIFENRGSAEEVLARLAAIIDKYGSASVADFYDLVGQGAPHTANNYGWKDLANAVVVPLASGGCHILMPNCVPLN